jgi:hypothetical protein
LSDGDRLEREFQDLPVVLTGHGDVFSAGIDFQYSFDIFGSGSEDKIRQWYRAYRETNLRIVRPAVPNPRPMVRPWCVSRVRSWLTLAARVTRSLRWPVVRQVV